MKPDHPLGYYVHVTVPGRKRAYLLATGSALTNLRLRASRFAKREDAERVAAEIARENEGHTARAVPVRPRKRP